MIMSVRLCLSYDHFKLDFTAYRVDNCSAENVWCMVDMEVMMLLVPAKVLCILWSYDFYDMTLSTE